MTKKIDLPVDDIFKEMFSRLDPKEYKASKSPSESISRIYENY